MVLSLDILSGEVAFLFLLATLFFAYRLIGRSLLPGRDWSKTTLTKRFFVSCWWAWLGWFFSALFAPVPRESSIALTRVWPVTYLAVSLITVCLIAFGIKILVNNGRRRTISKPHVSAGDG